MNDEVYSHGHHPSVTAAHAARTVASSAAYLEPFLEAGLDVLDVGCGPGSITAGFADLVAPGSVTGIDSSADVVAQAAEAHADLANVEFREGNVYDLDAADESFDLVHAHQLLQHLADPVAALREMRRVVRPGGIVAAREADFGAMTWFPVVDELDEWRELYRTLARGNGGEPDAGRRLPGWAAAAGFAEIEVSSTTWVYATAEDRRFLADSWAERVLHSAFAGQTLERGLADQRTLDRLAEGWRRWSRLDDGVFLMPSVEILARG
ncbi:methyltransferase domain-containing protein [Arthrobacter agilis]|jgi:ubiquinone/menaquinone biosynthesis C-methylase UbiE|uniref:methyltransferase domain-containing protein n=1 Tax=Arthrobacter agilis TaxID=37921 RepID=UPI00278712CE|nr:methyltransferase domain-containing protein [Arthrobacter agilis]MDQ0736134.1 ubiquinone/menaquinone biosynthesis C-methylase UbiE [Arthrobacter agilis]